MIHFFGDPQSKIYALQSNADLHPEAIRKLSWLFGNMPRLDAASVDAFFVGPRAAMITPWSTNATEITQNMGIEGIRRIESYQAVPADFTEYDPMLSEKYNGLGQDLFTVEHLPEPVREIQDIAAYNASEGLALNPEEVSYLEALSERLGRPLTDSEVFGFSQVNSEHCRHKIFNGTFIIDHREMPDSLFKLIRKTSEANPNDIVSAYKDNVAFIKGPELVQFAPRSADKPDYYEEKPFRSVLSLKAETHNFPTTVEPFNGAATGSGGEIRDRLAGGKGALPLAGTAVYMTAYSRLEEGRSWEAHVPARPWLYQTPMDILIKASNGASDFGNKFGQPLICGSVLTFEHEEEQRVLGYDKVIMLAGGIGYGKSDQALKDKPVQGDRILVMGGDNYRIGMGGAAVSSADTGAFSSAIELNAVQRSNPEMQKRAANAIRGLVEGDKNPVVSIHDHGAGGHLNCLSELVEETGGKIRLDKLPVGDPTLSAKELIGNESQERMGLVIAPRDLELLQRIADRERAPLYDVGEVTGDHRFTFASDSERPMDLALADMFGSSPKTVMQDEKQDRTYAGVDYEFQRFHAYLEEVLQLEAVACKDWLTNKVDRCVGGLVAKQQCAGPLQLPLNNCGVMALDFKGKDGLATSVGHSPVSGLIHAGAGSRNSIAEALTNLVWAPLEKGLKSVSLSANWMWPCNNPGEDARLYEAVQAASQFAIALGINIPTGKDSLSMKQKYRDQEVLAPGTVIISAAAHCSDRRKVVEPVFRPGGGPVYYLSFSGSEFALGGSSFAQVLGKVGNQVPDIPDADRFARAFDTLQDLIKKGKVLAGHDVASGGLVTTLLEMCFADGQLGADLDLTAIGEPDSMKLLFAENAGVVFQAVDSKVEKELKSAGLEVYRIGTVLREPRLHIKNHRQSMDLDVAALRDVWYKTSYLLDARQTAGDLAATRYREYKAQPLRYTFPKKFKGSLPAMKQPPGTRPKAAILREKGSNSEREMAHAMFLAGFDVKDVHMTDLISGRETLEDIRFIGAVGGFSNSDVLGSAKGWAGAFKYNDKANRALNNFFARPDTLSVGICNGCQLFMELGLIHPDHDDHGKLTYNDSGKHESAFTSVEVAPNHSVMLGSLAGSRLGVWISHGEGKFALPYDRSRYNIVATYGYDAYPSNPNGSAFNTAMLCDDSGRHLVTMPHIERSIYPWNWAWYEPGREDAISPWIEAFVNARKWIESNNG
ncbi:MULTISPECIES: phosphoribosylformylglycinamidine synthase [unclassified Robiginitalea]|uniref:phosphoribosylformylglycinamidine synthase n=1 Tax=Robiginitalea TaxID=252306 RepID=UPI00234BBCC6|nr:MULTISPECIES: phosphoribosylformylglycinamidine synthase [unclassified Robiginitalea]MDC6355027.1 phosphoribosylformylglycinamidine synthase [Robiginitalea sp. PM2]MDC6375294.1 phosphoribosylformylglycinamidine synthase [Robiginitalea sp. SP8]